MINTQIDPIKLQQILNKTPGKTVTSDEWNEIMNLLVEQGNLLMENYADIKDTLTSILNGEVQSIKVNTNVTHLGGRPASDYALYTSVGNADKAIKDWATTEINKKITKTYLYPNRVLVSGADSQIIISDVTTNDLVNLNKNIPLDILEIKASIIVLGDTLCGHKTYIQNTTPSSPKEGELWISW